MISLNDVLLAASNIPVNDPIAEIWGRQMRGGYKTIEYTGALPITIKANGDSLLDYRIYGASGGVGEPAESGEPADYKLPMTVANGNTAQTVPVYIGENQLDSVEGVSDYIDKSRGKIVRMIGEYTFTGDEAFDVYGFNACYTVSAIFPLAESKGGAITMQCDHPTFAAVVNSGLGYWASLKCADNACNFRVNTSQIVLRSTSNFETVAECKAYLKAQYNNGTPVKISYWLKTPIEEDPPVPFPEIPTIDGETVIDYDGEPKPSQVYVKYKGKG